MNDRICVFCGNPNEPWPGFETEPHGYGNNPEPVKPFAEGRCCNTCNDTVVLPARLAELRNALN